MILGRSPVTFENGMGPSPCATSSYARALAQEPDIGCRERGRKGTPGLEIGAQHDLVGFQEPGGFGHEMDARQHGDIGLGTRASRASARLSATVWKMSGV